MKKTLAIAAMAFAMAPAFGADVGVSINVPGVFGRVDIGGGDYGPPQVYNTQPVYVQRGPGSPPPAYLYVPVDQQRHWRRYCGQYNACGEPVFFVQENWYRNVYTPRFRDVQRRREGGPEGRPGEEHGPRGEERGPRGDEHRGDERRGG